MQRVRFGRSTNGSTNPRHQRGPLSQSRMWRRGSTIAITPSPIINMARHSFARTAIISPPPRGASDHVLLAADDMDQVPEDVQQGLVGLLDAVNTEAGHGEAVVAELGHPAAVAAGEAD